MATTTAPIVEDAKICEKGGGGLFLPMFGDFEQESSKGGRIAIYGICLMYAFYGAGVVSDYFMAGIETITSKKILVKNKHGRHVTVLVWNSTVANLTLMALGSSAPEILLSCLETLMNGFYSGDLGPSTIVGSAAFNLFFIIAICIMAIPGGDVRRIKELGVFYITGGFQIFAYVWLLLIVSVITPDVIDIWEAVVTGLFFPLLVIVCYCCDKGMFRKKEYVELKEDPENDSPQKRMKTKHTKIEDVYAVGKKHPRARSILVHGQLLERAAAMNHEFKEQASGRLKEGRGSQAGFVTSKSYDESLVSETVLDPYGSPIENPYGVITFSCSQLEVIAGLEEIKVPVSVLRCNGSMGQITCKYHAEHMSALPGYDYREAVGVVIFPDGVSMASIELTVLKVRPLETNEKFQLVLNGIEGGACFNEGDDGGVDSCVLTIVIKNGDMARPASCMDRCINQDLVCFGWDVWKEQVSESLKVEKLGDEESDEEPKALDYVFHCIAGPWKVFYAVMTPPPQWFGGWLLFVVALVHVGILTAMVVDLASMFGCVLDIKDLVTAIIVVAPGTSLPDLFASKAAAMGDDDADASIVNVTGSNSVNVYLGIGIPWTMSAVFWAMQDVPDKWLTKYPEIAKNYPDGAFVVQGGALSFSVLIFSCGSVVALCILHLRRLLFDGELGGPPVVQYVSASILCSLFVMYSTLSVIKASSDSVDVFQWIFMGIAGLAVVVTVGLTTAAGSGAITVWKAPENSSLLSNGGSQELYSSGIESQNITIVEDNAPPPSPVEESSVPAPDTLGKTTQPEPLNGEASLPVKAAAKKGTTKRPQGRESEDQGASKARPKAGKKNSTQKESASSESSASKAKMDKITSGSPKKATKPTAQKGSVIKNNGPSAES